jgi:hypothetical protein
MQYLHAVCEHGVRRASDVAIYRLWQIRVTEFKLACYMTISLHLRR